MEVTFDDIDRAHQRIAGHARRTPALTSATVDALTGAEVFFKCENFQRMGAFKFRGAYNALAQLSAEEKHRGVVAFSSGNHAQAVALAGKLLGVPRVIVMPADAPKVKVEATRGYGAEIVLYEKNQDREQVAGQISSERGLTLIPPYDHPHIIAGQGTAAKELIEDVGELDLLMVPCGGGGLLSGCAVAARHLSPECRVIGVEPAAGDDATRSFRTKTLQTVKDPQTIADGARTPSLGTLTFPLVLQHVSAMTTVDDAQLLHSMFCLWERLKLVVEPTGAVATAAVLKAGLGATAGPIVAVLSGGNVDLEPLFSAFRG
jgi:threonine dehydratase